MRRDVYFPTNRKNLCNTCKCAKDKFRESCYCTKYGIIITYGKAECRGYEQVRESEDTHTGRNVRQRERVPQMAGTEIA